MPSQSVGRYRDADAVTDPLLAWGAWSGWGSIEPRVPGLEPGTGPGRGLGQARSSSPLVRIAQMCRLDSKDCHGSSRSWSTSTNKAINHWPCRGSSGRPPPNWVEQLSCRVTLGTSYSSLWRLSFRRQTSEHCRPHADSRTTYRAHSFAAPARRCPGPIFPIPRAIV